MLQYVIDQWDVNKQRLEDYFRSTPQSEYASYKSILQKVIELVVTKKGDSLLDPNKITVVDDGDWQGTQLFLIPTDDYQPSVGDYLLTHTYYGSCSGCDTLQGIRSYEDDLPTEDQIKQYMTVALHLVQRMKTLGQ